MVSMSKLEPAYSLIRKFDTAEKSGAYVIAEALGLHRVTVQRWATARENGGTGGVVPPKHHGQISRLAKEMGVKLKAEDLISVEFAA